LLDIYKVVTPDIADANWDLVSGQGTAGRTALGQYTGITDVGTKVFSASIDGYLTSTYNTRTNNTNAEGLLNVNSNSLFTFPVGGALSQFNFSLGGNIDNGPTDWSVSFGGPIKGDVVPVPEPSTYGLIAAGALLGLVAFRRMKVRASAV
jgi:hypothetical protein